MARVTVEDCIDKVENRFDLVLLASHRARMISSGSQITIDRDNDKNPVVALREIADRTGNLPHTREIRPAVGKFRRRALRRRRTTRATGRLLRGGGGREPNDQTGNHEAN